MHCLMKLISSGGWEMKRFMKTKRMIGVILIVAVLTGIVGITGMAQTNKRSVNIKSKGIIDFENGTAVIDASDLAYLADEIDLLENTYKSETVNALNQVGTYYKLDGSTTFNRDESTLSAENAALLPFNSLVNGIVNSQSIPTERTYSGILPGEDTETIGNISAANAENLSLGTAAWVNGELIVGTGGDNNSYYSMGQATGCRVLYLGAGTSFDLSTLNLDDIDYSTLTKDNFIVEATGSSTNKGSDSHVDNYNTGALAEANVTKNYNADIGILTAYVSCKGGYYTNAGSVFSESITAKLSVKAYLVVGTIE